VTARHVIDEAYGQDASLLSRNLREEEGHLFVLYWSPDVAPETNHYVGGLLPVEKIYSHTDFDFAMLKLTIPLNTQTNKFLPMPPNKLTLRLPKIGEKIVGLGYRSMNWVQDIDDNVNIDHLYTSTLGIVEEIHYDRRDRNLPFPCFQTSARFDGGMSGGPVFLIGEGGPMYVGGMICSSFQTAEPFISYAAILAPIFGMQVEAKGNDNEVKPHLLWEFVKGGAVLVDRSDVVVGEGPGLLLSFRYPENITYNLGAN